MKGFTLIEVLIAVVMAAIVAGALNSVLLTALEARSSGRQSNELVYQGRFALERMVAAARATAPGTLATPAPGTTASWFAPAMYCLNAAKQLVETTTADLTCSGTTVIADNVIAFSAQPASTGPVDDPVGVLALTLQGAGQPITLTSAVRLGGGTR